MRKHRIGRCLLLTMLAGCCRDKQVVEQLPQPISKAPVIRQQSQQVWTFNNKTLTLESTGNISATGTFDGKVLTLTVTTE